MFQIARACSAGYLQGGKLNSKIISLQWPYREGIADNTRHPLLKADALTSACLWAGVISTQQPLTGGANLFAPSSPADKAIDAEQGLPVTSFFSTEGPGCPRCCFALNMRV